MPPYSTLPVIERICAQSPAPLTTHTRQDPVQWMYAMLKYRFYPLPILWLLALAACSVPQPASVPAASETFPAPLASPTAQVFAAAEAAPTENPTPIITAAPVPRLCTPLRDVPFSQLPALVSNPYHPPRPGYDDPHAGIDLAVTLPNSQVAISGHPVQAALPGRVAMIINDRFPFGNAVVIETPLEELPEEWWQAAEIPTPAPTTPSLSALTCPSGPEPAIADPDRRSLYILYAHLKAPPAFSMEDGVNCGQQIGTIGDSGNALNPHLHFETRVAPAGIRLVGMAHYHASVTTEEMRAYCLWSVNGLFQLVDPQRVLALHP